MKTNYEGFRGWINYVRDYKDNKDNDLISANEVIKANNKIQRLEKKVEQLSYIGKEKDNLIMLREKRIEATNNKLTSYIKRNDELRSTLETQCKITKELEEKVKEKELARRKNAGAIGGLKAENNKLKQDLERANQKIIWLKTNQKAPTKEEILAYEMRMKEVEKRQKQK